MNKIEVEETGYSISAAPPAPPERRSGERHLSLLRVGAITVQGHRELCLIRNISAGGMMIRAYSSLRAGMPVSIELKQGEPVQGAIQWADERLAGIIFDEPIDVVGLLATDATGPQPRLPRIDMDCRATVRQQAHISRATVMNVSQGGLCVRPQGRLEVGGDVVVTLPGMAPVPGVVRWATDGCVGIGFNRPLVLSDLVAWLKERQGRGCERLAS